MLSGRVQTERLVSGKFGNGGEGNSNEVIERYGGIAQQPGVICRHINEKGGTLDANAANHFGGAELRVNINGGSYNSGSLFGW